MAADSSVHADGVSAGRCEAGYEPSNAGGFDRVQGEARGYDAPMHSTRPAALDDISSWLGLVPEVENLFGPMPDLEAHIRRGIQRGTALVVTSGDEVAGAALLSRDGGPHHIRWLAVRQSQRRQGVGAAMMAAILESWPTGDVDVVTFTAEAPDGAPARRLYERFGFVWAGPSEPAPDGGPRDLFVLRRESADLAHAN